MRAALLAIVAILVAGCAGAPPTTPLVIYVTQPPAATGTGLAPTASATPTKPATPTPSGTPETHYLTVRYTLTSTDDVLTIDEALGTCTGYGPYDDIEAGLQFDVKDTHGELVGFGSFGRGQLGNSSSECIFTGYPEDPVPDLPIYVIDTGRRGAVNFTHQELESHNWTAELSIGN